MHWISVLIRVYFQVQILALAEYVGVVVTIEYLDGRYALVPFDK